MALFRLKQNFTAGELSPYMADRTDFERHKNGCKVLKNMIVRTQGPVSRRSGFRFIYDLTSLGLDVNNPKIRFETFIFNEVQAYVLVFFEHESGVVRVVFATEEGLVVYPDPPTDPCPPTDPDPFGVDTLGGHNGTVAATPFQNPGEIVYIDMPAGFDIDSFDYAQSADYFYMVQTGLKPHALVRYAHDCWVLLEITFTDEPEDWSDDYGWPETITFFQQRLAVGGNLIRRQTIWMSKAGDFHDFGAEATPGEADAVTFTLDSGTQNKIMWLQAVKALNVGTLGNEWTVSGGANNSVTPTNVLSLRQTDNGSERIKPLMVGLTTLFVERFARNINEFVYDYNMDSFKTSDVTILAPHLTEQSPIRNWDYQQVPDSIIWCTRDDGRLLALTYQREHKVVGWHWHETNGLFIDVATLPSVEDREDELWVAVERSVQLDPEDPETVEPRWYIEKKSPQFKGTTSQEGRFLDSHLVYDGEATNILTGLEHLEGRNVSVLADGAVHPDVQVVGGQITLQYETSHAVVGLAFESEVRPHLPEIPTEEGTSMTRVQKISSLAISLYRSLGMEIGVDHSEDGERIEEQPFRRPTDLTGRAVPLYTGVYPMTFMEGFDRKSEYFIRQRQPLPLTVLSIVDEIEVNP